MKAPRRRLGDYVFDCEADFRILEYASIVVCLHLQNCSMLGGRISRLRQLLGRLPLLRAGVTLDFRAKHYMYHPTMVRNAAGRLGLAVSVR
jgi:hypothetical protein